MVRFSQVIEKFGKKGEKTGWTYIAISASLARKMNPGTKVSYRVKGRLDDLQFEGLAIMPMGKGDFILPLNATLRKQIRKGHGDKVAIEMEYDPRKPALSGDLMKCLKAEPPALAFFKTLPGSHQLYFSKWVEGAKTVTTRTKRIVMAVTALAKGLGFPQMLRAHKQKILID